MEQTKRNGSAVIDMEPQPTGWNGSINDSCIIDVQPESLSNVSSDSPALNQYYRVDDDHEEANTSNGGKEWLLIIVCVGILVMLGLIISGWILFVVFVLPFIPCMSQKGRRRFLNCCKIVYEVCPLIGCEEKEVNNVNRALERYAEDVPRPKEVEERLRTDSRMLPIIESIEKKYPDFFFHFIPTGSLVERLGKSLATSNSVLASDYDIMLVPSGISVGNHTYDTFRPVKAPLGGGNIAEGFLWLDLNDQFLEQWDKFCLHRQIRKNDEDYENESAINSREENFKESRLLSTYMLKSAIKEGIEDSKDIKFSSRDENDAVRITVNDRGPALSVRISEYDKYLGCCQHKEKDWEADFTLGLRCSEWPENVLEDFFDEKRKWPNREVIDRIQRYGCHLVPKPSADFKIKLHLHAESKYARSPGLEWRYSFSVAEYILSEHIPEQARIAFLGFKAMVKKHINKPLMRFDVKISSFALKCILYRLLETKEPEYWETGEQSHDHLVESTYDELFFNLIGELNEGRCPNFWLPRINLFEELKDTDRKVMVEWLMKLKVDKMKYLISPWLECERCMYWNCCFVLCTPSSCCGEGDIKDTESFSKKKDLKPIEPPFGTCYTFQQDTCPCNCCLEWKTDFNVY